MHHSFLLISARRGSNPQSIFNGNAENTGNADKHWSCNNVRNVLYAVSYTHLDVYKRQEQKQLDELHLAITAKPEE